MLSECWLYPRWRQKLSCYFSYKMDLSGMNPSPTLSDKGGSWSWAAWGSDNCTETNNELYGLVEDKEIAARAVAFVVNSTRKGIVPLCADVANLLRIKQGLEKKVRHLKRENDALRSSASLSYRPSDSTSPTPASLSSHNSYTETCIKALQEAQERYNRSSSRCSNCSSLSYSPKIDKSQDRLPGMHSQYTPLGSREKQGSSKSVHSLQSGFREVNEILAKGSVQLSSYLPNKKADLAVDEAIYLDDEILPNDDAFVAETVETKGDNYPLGDAQVGGNQFETRVEVHNCDSDINGTDNVDTVNESEHFTFHIENEITKQLTVTNKTSINNGADEQTNVQYNNSDNHKTAILETTADDNGKSIDERNLDLNEISDTTRRRSLPEVVSTPNPAAYKVNAQISKHTQCSFINQSQETLEDQFFKAVKSNSKLSEELKQARKEMEILRQRLRQAEELRRQRGYDEGLYPVNDNDRSLEDNGYYTSSNKTTRHSSVNKKSSPKRMSATGVSYGGPIPGCKCSACQEGLGSDDDLSHYSDHLMDEPQRYAVNSKLLVQLDDHVVVKGDKSGTIRYIGHIDRSRQSSILYVGLELDTPVGKHDGYHQGKRYFYCGKDRGLFVPLQDVLCKGNKNSKTGKQELSAPSSSRSRKGHKKGQGQQDEDAKLTEL